MDIEIQTYWNVETLYYAFSAVASTMASAGFAGLLKLVFLPVIAIGMFGYMNKQLEITKWLTRALAFVIVLNLPIARVALTDKTRLEPPRVVDNVSFALTVTAQTINLVFGALTNTYETVFSVLEDLGLQKGDVGFGHRILKQINNATIHDPGLRFDLMQFIKKCMLHDVKNGETTPQQIVGSTDIWNVIFNNTSPARFVTYNILTNVLTTDTCINATAILKEKVNDTVTVGQAFYGKQVFTRVSSDAIAISMFVLTVDMLYDWVLNNSSNALDVMKQTMFNNIWKEAGTELLALLDGPARAAEVNALAGAAQVTWQANGSNSTLSLLAQETPPYVCNWIEAIIYGLFPIVVALMVVSSTKGVKEIIAGYMMSLAWIGLWPVLLAIINHLPLMHLRYKVRALELAAGVSFQLTGAFNATLINERVAIGYMVVLVPFVAGAIIKPGQGSLMGVADRMMTGFASAGATVGASNASGNVSMGQAGLDTALVSATSVNEYDSNIGLRGGGATIGRGNDLTATMAANGAVALQQFQNRMLMQMNMDHRLEAGRNQEAHRIDTTSTRDQLARRYGDSSSLTDVKGHDTIRGQYQNTGVVATRGSEGGYGGQRSTGQNLDRNLCEGSHFHTVVGANDQLHMNLGAGRGNPNDGGAPGAGGAGGVSDPREEKRIADTMKQGGVNQQQIDQVLKNYRGGKGDTQPSDGLINAGLGYSGVKTYTTEHGRDRSVDTVHGNQEAACTECTFAERGSRTEQAGVGSQSAQSDCRGRDATLTDVDGVSRVRDVSDHREFGIGDRANRNDSNSFTTHKGLMTDSYLFERVAICNDMTVMRSANQSEDRIMGMVQDYVSEKGMVQQATTMPQQTFAGKKLPAMKGEPEKRSAKDHAGIPQDIQGVHKKKVAQTGYGGTAPLKVDTSTPPIIAEFRGDVQGQLDPKNKGSILARAGALGENVNARASPDKAVGAGRVNSAAVNEDNMIRDGKGTVQRAWGKLTGGDGTADDEKLNNNTRRETVASVRTNNGSK